MNREIKYRAWNKEKQFMSNWDDIMISLLTNSTNVFISNNFDLMQFTGLKDKNGKEIYDGDIINACYGVGTVEFNKTTCSYKYCFKLDSDDLWLYNDREVIGTIYENPELLEK